MKKIVSILLVAVLVVTVTGCSFGGGTKESKKEKQTVEFWYHAADEKSNAIFEKLIDNYNQTHDDYEFKYTGFSNKDFPDKISMAIATNTMPDVISLGFSNIMTYVSQDALVPVTNYFSQWKDESKQVPEVVDSLKNLANGEVYGFPFCYNQDISWYNKKLFDQNGIKVPTTINEFTKLCQQYANPSKGTYFFSLRGSKPYDNLLSWIFTYSDGAGYGGSYFDANNNCIINKPQFVDALNAYADIYKNKWVSGDSVNNGFNEMVAEFGAGTSMYIMHNSSSKAQHDTTLGAGNYVAVKSLANDSGRYYNSIRQPQVFSICKTKGDNGDYSGAVALCEYLASTESVNAICEGLGNVPVNTECYNADWFKNDPFMPLYQEIANDKNNIQIKNPYWLSSYFNFINNDMTTDFQALLLGQTTAQKVLDKWADTLTSYQKDYLAGTK